MILTRWEGSVLLLLTVILIIIIIAIVIVVVDVIGIVIVMTYNYVLTCLHVVIVGVPCTHLVDFSLAPTLAPLTLVHQRN